MSRPDLVQQARGLAEELGFERSCSDQTGTLLSTLAATVRAGVIGEIGTGCGVGTAWMASAAAADTRIVTVEIDDRLASVARSLFIPMSKVPSPARGSASGSVSLVTVLQGDWRQILAYAPFRLLFADAAAAKQREPEILLDSLEPGGMIVLDDLTPGRTPEEDEMRRFWFRNSRLSASEVVVREGEAVLLATRRT